MGVARSVLLRTGSQFLDIKIVEKLIIGGNEGCVMIRKLAGLLCVGLIFIPAAVGFTNRAEERVQVRYRNAAERIADKYVDKVLDKVFGTTPQEKEFIPVVRGNLYVVQYPREKVVKVLLDKDIAKGYRDDEYTGSIDILREVGKGLSNVGVQPVMYDKARQEAQNALQKANIPWNDVDENEYIHTYYPYSVIVKVTDYNGETVGCAFTMRKTDGSEEIFVYNGYVMGNNMGESDKNLAVQAIVDDFMKRLDMM